MGSKQIYILSFMEYYFLCENKRWKNMLKNPKKEEYGQSVKYLYIVCSLVYVFILLVGGFSIDVAIQVL